LYYYSEREGTKTSYMSGNVPEPVRIERLKEAIELQRKHSCEQHNMQVNTSHVVLVKDTSKDRRGWFGYTETNIPVVFTSDKNNVDIGSFVNVRIEATSGSTLIGRNE
ncbi:MAG TPA: TRAM domain-containing protein, partial [Anaerolineae bacterium]|nr:TRAM domain-containing protein [Anaerolineae bacterium]